MTAPMMGAAIMPTIRRRPTCDDMPARPIMEYATTYAITAQIAPESNDRRTGIVRFIILVRLINSNGLANG